MTKPELKSVRVFWTPVGEKPGTGTWIGSCYRGYDGWWFNPYVSGRKPSRRLWPTWEASLPRWTGGLNGTTSCGLYDDGSTDQ